MEILNSHFVLVVLFGDGHVPLQFLQRKHWALSSYSANWFQWCKLKTKILRIKEIKMLWYYMYVTIFVCHLFLCKWAVKLKYLQSDKPNLQCTVYVHVCMLHVCSIKTSKPILKSICYHWYYFWNVKPLQTCGNAIISFP